MCYNLSILLYIPENEHAIISQLIINNTEDLYDLYSNNNKIPYNSTSSDLPITNRLFVNLTEEDKKDKYMLIEVKSNYDNLFNLIISKFHDFDSSDNSILFPQNLFRIKDNQSIQVKKNKSIRMHLINGGGYFKFKDDNNIYNLNYENQEILTIINKNNEDLQAFDSSNEEEFIFYLNMQNELNNKGNIQNYYDLTLQKTNYIKYYSNDKEEIFQIYLKIETIKDKDLYINYYFSKLETYNEHIDDSIGYINCKQDSFQVNAYDENKTTITKNESNYFIDTRKGYVYITNDSIKESRDLYIEIGYSEKKNPKNNYKVVYLDITPLYIEKEIKNIELPRNCYLDFKLFNKSIPLNFYLSKPSKEYKYSKIELSYNDLQDYNLSLVSNDSHLQNYTSANGKIIYYIIDNSINYSTYFNISSITDESHIFIRHSIYKNNITKFILTNNKIPDPTPLNDKNNSFYIEHQNIKSDGSVSNYTINYLIRLYDSLDHFYDEEIDNIYKGVKLLYSYRKELNETELKQDKVKYDLIFDNLNNGEFSISIIGEVIYNDTVEYFSYHYATFHVKPPKDIEFDEVWIAPLVIVLVILVGIFLYLVHNYIQSKKKKIADKNENGGEDKGKFVNSANISLEES